MKKRIHQLLILPLILLMVTVTKAQDPHFSQFYNSPLTLNPAMTGLMNSEIRAIGNYRSQWASISAPFNTMSASIDFSIMGKLIGDDILGLGMVLLNDQAGSSELRNTQAHLSFAYSKAINGDGNNYISLGGQFGVAQQRINFSKLLFDNQIQGEFLNPGMGSGENISTENNIYMDFSAGLAWSYAPDQYSSFYAGAAIFHLNQPQVSYMDDATELLYSKISAYAGMELRLNHMMSIIPRGVFLMQGRAKEITAGALMRFYLKNSRDPNDRVSLYLGTMHRLNDAQIFITRFDYGPVGLSLSYDMTISELGGATRGNGGIEIALIYKSAFARSNRAGAIRCPSF